MKKIIQIIGASIIVSFLIVFSVLTAVRAYESHEGTEITGERIFEGNIRPLFNNTYDFGTSAYRWTKGWFSDLDATNATIGTLSVTNSVNPGPLEIASSTNPTIRFRGDTNTGISWRDYDELGLMTNGTDRLVIDSSGDITIGQDLTVSGSATTTGSHYIENDLTIMSGAFGIGTTDPARPFQMVGDGTAETGWARFGLSATEYTEIGHRGSNSAINAVGDGDLDFRHDGVDKMSLTDAGDLTITNGLNVVHATTTGHFAADSTLYVRDGNVGIGTTAPTNKLHIVGTTAADAVKSEIGYDMDYVTSAASGDWSLALGSDAGNLGEGQYYYVITYVTAIGETEIAAKKNITTDATHHRVNITLPVSADYRVTERKIYRTPVGGASWAVYLVATIADNTTTAYEDNIADASLGSDNMYFRPNTTNKGIMKDGETVLVIDNQVTIVGVGAGNIGTATGGRNSFFGHNAGKNITTGNDNHIYGYDAGGNFTTGGSNVMIGSYAGYHTTGSKNHLIGYMTGARSNGSYNHFIGYKAGENSAEETSVDYNIGLGSSALKNIQTGSDFNVALGYDAGHNSGTGLTGGRNIILGSYAGTTITTGNSNILIGYNTEPPAATDDYKLNIGDTIYGDLSAGNVGIGTTSPYKLLSVAGDTHIDGDLTVDGTINGADYGFANGWLLTENFKLDKDYKGLTILDENGNEVFEITKDGANYTTAEPVEKNRWYLLGLIGLLGLIPRIRR